MGATGGTDDENPWPDVVLGTRRTRRAAKRGPSAAKLAWLEQRSSARTSPTRPRRRPRHHPDAVRLASAVRVNVPALRATGVGRLIPAMTRFAVTEQPWTAAQLIHAAFAVAKTKGWTTVDARVRHPAAWWAGLLAGIEHAAPPAHHDAGRDRDSDGGHAVATSPWPTAAETRRGETHWDAARRCHQDLEQARRDRLTAELRLAEQHRREEDRDERAGRGLCEHGAGGAADAGRSPRCAMCRAADASSPNTVTAL